jgi:hypothetical protein
MLNEIFMPLDRKTAIQAGYLGIRVLKHFARSPHQVVVPGLASEPSEAAVEVVNRIVQEIEAVEGVPVSLLDNIRRGAYISQLSDFVMEAAKRGWSIDFAGGTRALDELRQIGIGRTS